MLHQELRQALKACGLSPVLPVRDHWQPHADMHAVWRELFCQGKPRLLLSVNLRGLDAEGRVFHLCRDMGVPYLGRARIGHDADNMVVPFGVA